MRNADKDLELCDKAKNTCNKDDGVRCAESAKRWIKRAVEAERLLQFVWDSYDNGQTEMISEIEGDLIEFLGGSEG